MPQCDVHVLKRGSVCVCVCSRETLIKLSDGAADQARPPAEFSAPVVKQAPSLNNPNTSEPSFYQSSEATPALTPPKIKKPGEAGSDGPPELTCRGLCHLVFCDCVSSSPRVFSPHVSIFCCCCCLVRLFVLPFVKLIISFYFQASLEFWFCI